MVTSNNPARDRTASASRRLALALALLPIVPAVSIVGVVGISDFAPSILAGNNAAPGCLGVIDELRLFHTLFAVLWVVATILIWRTAVVWTLGRKWLTALVCLIPFVQVIYAKPLWTMPGCRFLDDEILRVGQFQVGAGLFIWVAVWAWWGTEKLLMRTNSRCPGTLLVGPLAPPLAMSIGLQPIVFAAFLLAMQGLQDFANITNITCTFALTAVVATCGWWLIWRRCTQDKRRALQVTAGLAVACLGFPLALQWCLLVPPSGGSSFPQTVLACLPVIGWGVFMAATIAVLPLREFGNRSDEPRCLKCGYSLHGLKATRCPECGDEPTLDQLWRISG